MTSRHAHDGTRWKAGPIAGPAGWPDPGVGPEAAEPEAVPEACDLPPKLECGLRALVDLAFPAVSFTVLPEPESVTRARHFTVSRLIGWGTPALAGDVGLVVSELVTNALRHGATAGVRGRPSRPSGSGHGTGGGSGHGSGHTPGTFLESSAAGIRLRLLYRAPWLLCGIMDSSTAAPRRREPDYIAETGRGLHLVESFSTRWGWCGLPQGKIVWALFRAP